MAKPNITWLYNDTANDGPNTGNASGGNGGDSSHWVVIALADDMLMFTDAQQLDGGVRTGAKYSVIIPGSGSSEAPKTFIDDLSLGIFNQVPLAGTVAGGQSGGNKRYPFAIYFDGPTASIPYLEAWDSDAHDHVYSPFLGGYEDPPGTWNESPTDSTLRAIATTNAAPGSDSWTGTPLAGITSHIALDTAPLAGAKNLYFNIKQLIPSSFVPRTETDTVLSLRYLYS